MVIRLSTFLALVATVLADDNIPTTTTHKQRPPPPKLVNGNPLVALAGAFVGFVLYLLQVVQNVVAFVTITIPT